jgi:molybdopterin converting factor small subunit
VATQHYSLEVLIAAEARQKAAMAELEVAEARQKAAMAELEAKVAARIKRLERAAPRLEPPRTKWLCIACGKNQCRRGPAKMWCRRCWAEALRRRRGEEALRRAQLGAIPD